MQENNEIKKIRTVQLTDLGMRIILKMMHIRQAIHP